MSNALGQRPIFHLSSLIFHLNPMPNEYETRVLDIDVGEIEKKLLSLGATLTEKEVVMKRRVFDIQPYDNEDKGKRLRLRQQGDKTTLAYKER